MHFLCVSWELPQSGLHELGELTSWVWKGLSTDFAAASLQLIMQIFGVSLSTLQYQSAFQSSNLIGWIRVNLRCC